MNKVESHDQAAFLHVTNQRYREEVKKYILNAYEGDLGKRGDITTRFFLKNKKRTARVVAKEDGILAGMEEITWFIQHIAEKKGEKLNFNSMKDGSELNGNIFNNENIFPNQSLSAVMRQKSINHFPKHCEILTVTGPLYTLFEMERTILNVLQRMSGIATQTRKLLKKIENPENNGVKKNALRSAINGGKSTILPKKPMICATRKTLLGLLDKKAVSIGGGGTHRLGLYDAILLKKNHLKLLGYDFEKILHTAEKRFDKNINEKNKYYLPKFFEVEIENENEAMAFINIFSKRMQVTKKWHIPIILMFDNMKPETITRTIGKIRKIQKSAAKKNQAHVDILDDTIFEASGGINEINIGEYAKTGVDILSLGSLTHSSRSLDMHMIIE